MPNLLEATNDYWRKLNELEAAYQQGEVSLEEVDASVKQLMAELGRERKATFQVLLQSFSQLWDQQRDVFVGVALIGILTYAWATVS